MAQKNKKMLSRLPRLKFVNFILIDGNKACAEKLLKKSLKSLIKTNKKKFKIIVYLALNLCLPTFKLETTKVLNKRQKLIKTKPSIISSNNCRVFIALKMVALNKSSESNCFVKSLKQELLFILSLKSKTVGKKILNQEQVLTNKTALVFYRW